MPSTTVAAVVRSVIAETDPGELPTVLSLMQYDADTARRILADGKASDEPLGFGVVELAVMATPIVWAAVDEAARTLGAAIADGTGSGVAGLVKKLGRRRTPRLRTVPELTPAQIAEIRQQVIESAMDRGLGKQRATVLGDAVFHRLTEIGAGRGLTEPEGGQAGKG